MDWWRIMSMSKREIAEHAAHAEQIRRYRRQMRRARATAGPSRDDSQDAQIAGLRSELEQVEDALALLSRLLIEKGVLSADELSHLLDATEAEDPPATA